MWLRFGPSYAENFPDIVVVIEQGIRHFSICCLLSSSIPSTESYAISLPATDTLRF